MNQGRAAWGGIDVAVVVAESAGLPMLPTVLSSERGRDCVHKWNYDETQKPHDHCNEDEETQVLKNPWERVKNPTAIPAGVDIVMLEELDDDAFARLLRDNMLPRTPADREAWEWLWDLLISDDDLAERAFDVLDDFLDQVKILRADPDADESALKRAKKFETHAGDAWARLQGAGDLTPATKVRRLVFAITKHQALTRQRGEVTQNDEDLWGALDRLGLAP